MGEAQLFTVQVWRAADGFRASVRAVGDEHARLFTAAAPLADFLAQAGLAGPPPSPASKGENDEESG